MATADQFQNVRSTLTATIADGASLSAALSLFGNRIAGFITPAGMEGAAFTFQGSADGTTYANVKDEGGTELSVTIAASVSCSLTTAVREKLSAFSFVKVRTGTSGAPTNQAGGDGAAITVILEPL
jgi:hypothetical protein